MIHEEFPRLQDDCERGEWRRISEKSVSTSVSWRTTRRSQPSTHRMRMPDDDEPQNEEHMRLLPMPDSSNVRFLEVPSSSMSESLGESGQSGELISEENIRLMSIAEAGDDGVVEVPPLSTRGSMDVRTTPERHVCRHGFALLFMQSAPMRSFCCYCTLRNARGESSAEGEASK